jgi:hypothetical protein
MYDAGLLYNPSFLNLEKKTTVASGRPVYYLVYLPIPHVL